MTEYKISWKTTVVEYHRRTFSLDELPEVLREAIRTAGTLTHSDDEEILDFVGIDEGSSTVSYEEIEDRIITGITKSTED